MGGFYTSGNHGQPFIGSGTTFNPRINLAANLIAEWNVAETSTLYSDSALTTPASVSGVVGGWDNYTNPGTYHIVQSTAADQPVWTADYFGSGLDAVNFTTSDNMAVGTFGGVTDFTIAFAVDVQGTGGAFSTLFDGSTLRNALRYHNDGKYNVYRGGSTAVSSTASYSTGAQVVVLTCPSSGDTKLYVNGSLVHTYPGATIGNDALGQLRFNRSNTGTTLLTPKLALGYVFDKVLDATEVSDLSDYMKPFVGL